MMQQLKAQHQFSEFHSTPSLGCSEHLTICHYRFCQCEQFPHCVIIIDGSSLIEILPYLIKQETQWPIFSSPNAVFKSLQVSVAVFWTFV